MGRLQNTSRFPSTVATATVRSVLHIDSRIAVSLIDIGLSGACSAPRDELHNANPVTEYRTYLSDVRGGMVGDMGFSLADFETYIAGLPKPDWTKIFAIVIEGHHEMFVRLAKR